MTKKSLVAVIIIFSVAWLILAAAMVGNYYYWKRTVTTNQNLQAQSQSQWDNLSASMDQQKATIQELQNEFTQFVKNQQQTQTGQTLNEIAYLLDLANLYLQINHDPDNAIKSLQLAQSRLKGLTDARLLSLKQAIASDLNALNDVPKLDTADILLRLQTLGESVGRLSFTSSTQGSSSSVQSSSPPEKKNQGVWYKTTFENIWHKFKNLFVVRYNGSPHPILPPDQRAMIHENIAVTLAQAQWAVLKQNAKLYQQSLNQVQNWITGYFPNSPERENILSRLSELAAINISPTLPDLNASLAAVQKAQEQLSTVAPGNPVLDTAPRTQPVNTQPVAPAPVPTEKNNSTAPGIEL
ncbi:MAG: uroporphyrinogen-III C-methyltransferase [Proteobacteria bacterium]|nr:uroporphyrinogen-III C-methyltransferase [Pseudomonadota bacterium]